MKRRDREEEDELESCTCEQLRIQLQRHGLNTLGHKPRIVDRLRRALADESAGLRGGSSSAKRSSKLPQQRRRKTAHSAEDDTATDPALSLHAGVFPLVLALTGSLSAIRAAMSVSKAWRAATEDPQLWIELFARFGLAEHVPRGQFPSAKIWFAAHVLGLRHFQRRMPEGAQLTSNDLLQIWTGSALQRCRYCKYSVPEHSLITRIDVGSMSWSTVHLACYLRKNKVTLAQLDWRLPGLVPLQSVQIAFWMLQGMPAELLPDGIGICVPAWSK